MHHLTQKGRYLGRCFNFFRKYLTVKEAMLNWTTVTVSTEQVSRKGDLNAPAIAFLVSVSGRLLSECLRICSNS